MTAQNLTQICWKQVKRHLQCVADPRSFREWSEHETVSPQPAAQPRLLFALAMRICLWKIQHFALRLLSKFHQVLRMPRKVTLQLHSVLRLPQKVTIIITWLYCYLTLLLLDNSFYLALLLLDDSYHLTLLLLDDSYYLTIPFTWLRCYFTLLLLDDSYYLTIPFTWLRCYFTLLLLDDSYYLTSPFTWLRCYFTLLLIDDSCYLTLLLLDSAMSFVYRKFLNLNFLRFFFCL